MIQSNSTLLANPRVRLILLGGIVVMALLFIWSISQAVSFRIVGISPNKILPTSTSQIDITFNRELGDIGTQPEQYVQLEPAISYSATMNGKVLSIKLLETPEKDSQLTVTLNNIIDKDKKKISQTIRYNVRYVPYNQLSDEEQAKQAAATGRPADKHPLLKNLPYDEIAFRIDYIPNGRFGTADSWQAEKDNFVVTIRTFTLKDGVPTDVYAQKTRDLRTKALDWIKEQGVNPDTDISIVYEPNDEALTGEEEFTGDGIAPNPEEFAN